MPSSLFPRLENWCEVMTGQQLSLASYDGELAERLFSLLVRTLVAELRKAPDEACVLAREVSWHVTFEDDGLWLTMSYRSTESGVGGDWRDDEDALSLYVRQVAYDLVGRSQDFRT